MSKRQAVLASLRLSPPLKTFRNYHVTPENEAAVLAFSEVAAGNLTMLLCFGSKGCGKSHLLKATALRLYGIGLRTASYRVWYEIIGALKGGLDKGSIPPYDEILLNYCRAPVLLIDDYGLGTTETAWQQSQFEIIVDYRYDRRLLTVVTTNLDHHQIPERVLSRFHDADIGRIVVNRAGDYRRRPGGSEVLKWH